MTDKTFTQKVAHQLEIIGSLIVTIANKPEVSDAQFRDHMREVGSQLANSMAHLEVLMEKSENAAKI